MQSVSRNLDPSVLATTLANSDFRGNATRIANVIVTSCNYFINQVEVSGAEEAKDKITKLIYEYAKDLVLVWNNAIAKNQSQLLLMDGNVIHHTGICLAVVEKVLCLWIWNNPNCATIPVR